MHLLFAPGRIDAPHHRAGVVSCRGFPNRVSVSGRYGTSHVPGEPPCRHAPLFDPGGTFKPGRLGFQVLPSGYKTTSASTLRSFRGSITRPACSLSTLRSLGRPTTTQDSVPAASQLCRGRLATPWVPLQGFRLPMSYLPPRPSFAWRTIIWIGIKHLGSPLKPIDRAAHTGRSMIQNMSIDHRRLHIFMP